MIENEFIIDIDPGRRPYNSYMALPLPLIQQLAPLLTDEILHGLINTDNEQRVVLHLHLEDSKIKEVQEVMATHTKTSIVNRES